MIQMAFHCLCILGLLKHAACLAQKKEFLVLLSTQEISVSCDKEEGLVSGEHIFKLFYIPAACQKSLLMGAQ